MWDGVPPRELTVTSEDEYVPVIPLILFIVVGVLAAYSMFKLSS